MNFTNKNVWHIILLAVCCIVIISVIAIFVLSPGNRIYIGTCGSDSMPMNYSTGIQPAFERSFLHEFGEQEPDRNLTLPPMKYYREKQQVIDTLLDRALLTGSTDSVIGLYESPDSRLLLIDMNTSITEVLESGDKIQTFSLTPVTVGTLHSEDNMTKINEVNSARVNAPPGMNEYNYSFEYSVAITRIDLVLPPQKNTTTPLYLVRKNNIDRYSYPDGRSFAEITTAGTFYVLYGQRVERVIGTSAVTLDPSWKGCVPHREISGEGTPAGEMKYTVKLAHASERILRSRLITTSAYIQQYDADMGSASQWKSSDSSGCNC
jgi:hypothetical protein